MADLAAPLTMFPVDRLTAVREWLWRHSSQPNGDPWDGDPDHLDRAAHNLLHELTASVTGTDRIPNPRCTCQT